ncbi:zinc transporter ZIP1-like [Frankliniella occidentalis]|uniref:Zinc transporter ZIP1-like n=1 Tax=Frankliniella occidentalis TaxID=133901 RepID=A0A9C6XBB6_FRAOC|nr:zinc transporter ZIP1-like [Frankliniella occidentalis]XP_052132545.1 zinc transporter ZIP1-like [Frankliniella occidentalis]XP_052132546.1 zinc transporter ZIP1-like [Frankliniella occidentalis]XP_052132547.1 zinc transporter ZIP1-like [Frankliniella occidentalis]
MASNGTELSQQGVLEVPADVLGGSGTPLLIAKVTAMVVLGVASMLVGLLPIKLARWLRWSTESGEQAVKSTEDEPTSAPPTDSATLSLLLCGGGGVLLCTTLVQLLPEVRLQLHVLQRAGVLPETRVPAAELLLVAGFLALYLVEELVHRHLHNQAHDSEEPEAGHHHGGHGHSHVPVGAVDSNGKAQLGTAARGLLVVLGLSVHELLEGLAVGLERSPARVWALFVAVASHKFVISFCVGVQLVGMGSRAAFVCAYVGAFSFMSALGIALGMAATASEGAAAGATATLMQGVAAGTLLYVVFFEVLEPQRASRHAGIRQLMAVTAGFAAMFAIQLAVESVSE